MSAVQFADIPADQRPPIHGDWVALAQPPLTNYMIAVAWRRGMSQPLAREFRDIIRQVRGYVEIAIQQGDAPEMPFYCNMSGVWVGVVDPESVDWSPTIAYNVLPA